MKKVDLPPEEMARPGSPLLALLPEARLLVSMITGAVVIVALYFGRAILMPLFLAFLLGFMLDPLVVRLKRWGLPRVYAVVAVMVGVLAALGLAAVFLGNQVSALSAQLPTYQSNIQHKLRELRSKAGQPGMFDGAVRTFDAVQREVNKAATSRSGPAVQRVQVEERPPTPMEQAIGWLEVGMEPLATAGIVLVFTVLVLLDRVDLRDRLLRLWGGSLHRSTDAMDEAGRRISRYLTMQLAVNVSYGVPMALGLWAIGVPGALLWGAVAALMRFVPYVGPMIAAVFPLALAFAVDPGWDMVLWTGALIVVLELISNNIVEPLLYGASTGLSAMSLMVAATFWTALWGPIGLIMSTPLTVCLLVVGHHLPRFAFLNVLLGSQPALDPPTRLYQRLLAGDEEEAIEVATQQAHDGDLTNFYDDAGLPVLRMATSDHASVATAEHRHRVVTGMDRLLDELTELHPPPAGGRPAAVCIGGKWEVDTLAARMLAHALSLQGRPADHRPAAALTAETLARLDLRGARTVCISYFARDPAAAARQFCKRLRRLYPDLRIVLGLWNAPNLLQQGESLDSLGADAVVSSIGEAMVRLAQFMGDDLPEGFLAAPQTEDDPARLQALKDSGLLDPRARVLLEAASRRAADIFDVPLAMVSLITEDRQIVGGSFGHLPPPPGSDGSEGAVAATEPLDAERRLSLCGHVVADGHTMVVPDIARDQRFAHNPVMRERALRFYAGAPLVDGAGFKMGTLCLMDVEPRTLTKREVRLLEAMAADLMSLLRAEVEQWSTLTEPREAPEPPSATVGQLVPGTS